MESFETIVLVTHEPKRDPRVDWVSRSFSKYYSTAVIGVLQDPKATYKTPYNVYTGNDKKLSLESLIFFFKSIEKGGSRFLFFKRAIEIFGLIGLVCLGLAIIVIKKLCWKLNWARTFYRTTKGFFNFWKTIRFLVFVAWLFRHILKFTTLVTNFNFDVSNTKYIYANDFDSLLAAIYLKQKNKAIKLIYDNHEFYPFQFTDAPKWFEKVLFFLEHILIKQVDEFIIVTPNLAEEYQQMHGLDKKVNVIPNFSPLESTEFSFNKEDNTITFLFQGGFATGRGIETLIKFWAKLSPENSKLVLRGPNNDHKKECIQLAKDLGLFEKTIFFPKAVSEEELINEAMKADVGVIPYEPININNRYCCPNKMSQYMQAGLAILANDLDFVKTSLLSAESGVSYSSNDYLSFEKSVKTLLDSSNLNRMKKNAKSASQSYFNWNTCERTLLELINAPVS